MLRLIVAILLNTICFVAVILIYFDILAHYSGLILFFLWIAARKVLI